MSALRASLLKAIEELKGEVVTMADLVLNNINESFLAFKTNNLKKAESLMKADDQVDQLEEDISKAALRSHLEGTTLRSRPKSCYWYLKVSYRP